MNNFTMRCQECNKLFQINDSNRHNWSKGLCDTCMVANVPTKVRKGQHA